MTRLEILRAARTLIAVPDNWTREVSARREDGRECNPASWEAACWCVDGAVLRCSKAMDEWYETTMQALRAHLPGSHEYVHDFNDHPRTTHEDVLRLFDDAIDAEVAT